MRLAPIHTYHLDFSSFTNKQISENKCFCIVFYSLRMKLSFVYDRIHKKRSWFPVLEISLYVKQCRVWLASWLLTSAIRLCISTIPPQLNLSLLSMPALYLQVSFKLAVLYSHNTGI